MDRNTIGATLAVTALSACASEAATGEVDLRTGGLESRGEVMGCNPRKYVPAK
jgi:hypothetical protein